MHSIYSMRTVKLGKALHSSRSVRTRSSWTRTRVQMRSALLYLPICWPDGLTAVGRNSRQYTLNLHPNPHWQAVFCSKPNTNKPDRYWSILRLSASPDNRMAYKMLEFWQHFSSKVRFLACVCSFSESATNHSWVLQPPKYQDIKSSNLSVLDKHSLTAETQGCSSKWETRWIQYCVTERIQHESEEQWTDQCWRAAVFTHQTTAALIVQHTVKYSRCLEILTSESVVL